MAVLKLLIYWGFVIFCLFPIKIVYNILKEAILKQINERWKTKKMKKKGNNKTCKEGNGSKRVFSKLLGRDLIKSEIFNSL